MKIWLPADPSRRALLVAIVCSVLLHVLVAASVYLAGAFAPKIVAKRGEPLFVDITPHRPAERGPRGNAAPPPPPRGPAAPPRPAARPSGGEVRPRLGPAHRAGANRRSRACSATRALVGASGAS